jgi:hypothetical protein
VTRRRAPKPTVDPNQLTIALRQLIAQHDSYTKGGAKLNFSAWLQTNVIAFVKSHPGTPSQPANRRRIRSNGCRG